MAHMACERSLWMCECVHNKCWCESGSGNVPCGVQCVAPGDMFC